MQNRTTNPVRVSYSLMAANAAKHRMRRTLQICFAVVIAFCAGLPSRAAAIQQNDVATTTNDSTASPEQTNAPANPSGGNPRTGAAYLIGADDVLSINVWKEPEITRSIPVRSDGKISLPLIGDVQAAGRTPMQLEEDIAARLKDYITNPQVAVIVQQSNSQKFNILGQVMKPGSFPLTAGTTVVDAIAIAGGFKDFAKKKGVYLLRQNSAGTEQRFNFNYDRFIKEKNTAQNIRLMPNDTIVVP